MQHNNDKPVVAYAVLVGDALILRRTLPNPADSKRPYYYPKFVV
jgi:hypothetical protein